MFVPPTLSPLPLTNELLETPLLDNNIQVFSENEYIRSSTPGGGGMRTSNKDLELENG